MKHIHHVAVLGSGVMGAGIAAQMANAGLTVLLLDIAPHQLTEQEKAQGLTLSSKKVRNRISQTNLEVLLRQSPAPLYSKSYASLIRTGNLEDDLAQLSACQWVLEAVVESLPIKQHLFQTIAPYLKPDTILSTNTSGLSIQALAESLPQHLRKNFLATHFFNPPRYMRLLEIVPSQETESSLIEFMADFCQKKLGKGVVVAKDSPNFIANRIGVYALCATIHHMQRLGLSVSDVDAITGPAIARPGSGTFRTLDIVGIDTFAYVARNSFAMLENDDEREVFNLPDFISTMIDKNLLGNKTSQGFYLKQKSADTTALLAFDPVREEYAPVTKTRFHSLGEVAKIADPSERIRAMIAAEDEAGKFAWQCLRDTLIYSYKRIPEIAIDIDSIDKALRWGFNWELGPFEIFDVLGVKRFISKAEQDGIKIPEGLRAITSFYQESTSGRRESYSLHQKHYQPVCSHPDHLQLNIVKQSGKTVATNESCSILDLDDGVFCLEFHSKLNTITRNTLKATARAVEIAEQQGVGLVIGNQGKNFSAGADLAYLDQLIVQHDFAEIDSFISEFQQATQRLKYAKVPVVAAPFGVTLGGGCEFCLHADATSAHAETAMGFVEINVGLLPAGGGCKELSLKAARLAMKYGLDVQPFIVKYFWQIAKGVVSKSAAELYELEYLDSSDPITMNSDFLLSDAKQRVLSLARNYRYRQAAAEITAPGRSVAATLQSQLWNLKAGKYLSAFDYELGSAVAAVLCGGDVPPGTPVSEQNLLDLERETFLAFCKRPETRDRIQHMLKTGKALRN